jgi:membrane-associated phospholipid phosphatase
LNSLGIKGKHNLKDRSIILGTAFIIMGTSVFGMKKITKVNRPDDSNITSFPSGHTATAFMGAEFLYQEYKDVSIWYGISGYVVASGVAYLRIYNNRHWLTDVVAGAGFGILSTKVAYWIYPFMKRTFFKDKTKKNGIVMPFYNGKEYGIGFSMSF